MGKIITLAEYAKQHSHTANWARKKAVKGDFKTAYTSGTIWLIDEEEEWPYLNEKENKDTEK